MTWIGCPSNKEELSQYKAAALSQNPGKAMSPHIACSRCPCSSRAWNQGAAASGLQIFHSRK